MPVYLDAMHCTDTALGKVILPLKACFVLGKAVYVQFDGSSHEGYAIGSFVILDANGIGII